VAGWSLLGLHVSYGEDGAGWLAFFGGATLPGASWQRKSAPRSRVILVLATVIMAGQEHFS
jgi:hypothetical protein